MTPCTYCWSYLLATVAPTVAPAATPCAEPPQDMVCVPAGPAIVGNDAGTPMERPRRRVFISTFYIDKHELTVQAYDECVAAGACEPPPYADNPMSQPFRDPAQPAVPLDWFRARAACAFFGKRLPTEWEWEKAARGSDGELYPWGNDPPTCARAWTRECAPQTGEPCTLWPEGKRNRWDCREHATLKVGSRPSGHHGIFDMAGNGYEWTASWAGPVCKVSCEELAVDPQGPCDGAFPCAGRRDKILRGGSWYWPADETLSSFRRAQDPHSGSHRLSVRCASTDPLLTRFPPRQISHPLPQPEDPTPPSSGEVESARGVRQDDLLAKQVCEEGGKQQTDCRDPRHYVMSNEAREHLFAPFVRNLGGGYTGVGFDQNYSLLAQARSSWVWLFDYDPVIVRMHRVLRVIILHAETPGELVEALAPAAEEQSLAWIAAEYGDDNAAGVYAKDFHLFRSVLWASLAAQTKPRAGAAGEMGWLRRPGDYAYVRRLYQQGRIVLLNGDLMGTHTLTGIGEAARHLGVPIRVFYVSNATETWTYGAGYRNSVRNLPFDEWSVVLQTLAGTKASDDQKGYWHYNVEGGLHAQRLLGLPGFDRLFKLIYERVGAGDPDLTTIGVFSS